MQDDSVRDIDVVLCLVNMMIVYRVEGIDRGEHGLKPSIGDFGSYNEAVVAAMKRQQSIGSFVFVATVKEKVFLFSVEVMERILVDEGKKDVSYIYRFEEDGSRHAYPPKEGDK